MPEQIFSILNTAALLSWILLAAAPRRFRVVPQIITGLLVPGLLAVVYVAVIVSAWGSSAGGFSSLADVGLLFDNPWLLLAGWTHYLAFDLFVGSWEVRDARERGVPHLLVIPCLALTFLFGPAGLLLYLGLRSMYTSAASVRAQAAV
jgi:hypothetical protein